MGRDIISPDLSLSLQLIIVLTFTFSFHFFHARLFTLSLFLIFPFLPNYYSTFHTVSDCGNNIFEEDRSLFHTHILTFSLFHSLSLSLSTTLHTQLVTMMVVEMRGNCLFCISSLFLAQFVSSLLPIFPPLVSLSFLSLFSSSSHSLSI